MIWCVCVCVCFFFFFINVQLGKKKILLIIDTALNTKTNMGQPHTN